MIYHLLDIGKENLGDRPICSKYFDRRPAERLSAAEIIDTSTHTFSIVSDYLNIIAVEHTL